MSKIALKWFVLFELSKMLCNYIIYLKALISNRLNNKPMDVDKVVDELHSSSEQ